MSVEENYDQVYCNFISEIASVAINDNLNMVMPLYSKVCTAIQHEARTGNKFEFLRWASLNDFSVPEDWVPENCYTALRKSPSWGTRWFPLTRETKVGRPK